MNPKLFSKELEFVSRAIEKKGVIPILRNVLVDQREGVCVLSGTDLENAAFSAIVGDPERICTTVPAEALRKAIGSVIKNDGFTLSASTDGKLTCLRSDTFEMKLDSLPADAYPVTPEPPQSGAVSLPLALVLDCFAATKHAIDKQNGQRFTLDAALFVLSEGQMRVVATDGHQMSMATAAVESVSPLDKVSKLVALSTIRVLEELEQGKEQGCIFSSSDTHTFWTTPLKTGVFRSVVARPRSGNFPDYERVIPSRFLRHIVAERTGLLNACERILPFTDERHHRVHLRAGGGRFTIGEGYLAMATTQKAEDSVVCRGDMAVGFSYEMDVSRLIKSIKSLTSQEVRLDFPEDPKSLMRVSGERNQVNVLNFICHLPLRD